MKLAEAGWEADVVHDGHDALEVVRAHGCRPCPADAVPWIGLKGWLSTPSSSCPMARLVSRTPGFRLAGHQHRWMSSTAGGHSALGRTRENDMAQGTVKWF